jgi:hypothetical protein
MPDNTKYLTQLEGATATVKALQTGKLLNPDKSLREIIAVAGKIPGLGDGSPVAWELITRDFVYRGIEGQVSKRISEQDVDALKESGAINFDIKLSEVLEIASRVPGLGGGGNPAAWELISRDFVLRGRSAFELQEAVAK